MKVGDVENIPESKKEDETWQLMRCEARERIKDELFKVWITGRMVVLEEQGHREQKQSCLSFWIYY